MTAGVNAVLGKLCSRYHRSVRVDLLADVHEDGSVIYLLATIRASLVATPERVPVNLVLAIDRSSSMRGPRIRFAIAAARELTERLESRDRLTIITFDNSAKEIFGPREMDEAARADANVALDGLTSGVGTNLGAAIRKGGEAITSAFVRGALSRLIILTDGQPSLGITDHAKLASIVSDEHARGVTTTTMGIGHAFEDELLAELARCGRGGYYYLSSPSDIPAAFGLELDGVFAIAATETTLRFVPHEDIVSVDVLHRVPTSIFDDGLGIEVGEVALDAPRQLLFKMVRNPLSNSKSLGKFTLTHSRPGGERGDPVLIGAELPNGSATERVDAARVVHTERLRLAAARAVDSVWAQRAAHDTSGPLFALETLREEVLTAREDGLAEGEAIEAILADMDAAEQAVHASAGEREELRRGIREQSQMTLLGRSVVTRLPQADEQGDE